MIVVIRQVAQHISLSLPLAGIAMLRHPFRFQASEKALHRCVVPAVTAAAHALFDPVAPEHLAEFNAGVMATLVRVKHQLLRAASGFVGHAQRTLHALYSQSCRYGSSSCGTSTLCMKLGSKLTQSNSPAINSATAFACFVNAAVLYIKHSAQFGSWILLAQCLNQRY